MRIWSFFMITRMDHTCNVTSQSSMAHLYPSPPPFNGLVFWWKLMGGVRCCSSNRHAERYACESVKFPQLHRSSLLAHELPGQSALEEACYWRRGSWRAAARRPSTQGKPLTELTRRDETLREIRLSTLSGFMGIFRSALFICFFFLFSPIPSRRHKLKRSTRASGWIKCAGKHWRRRFYLRRKVH